MGRHDSSGEGNEGMASVGTAGLNGDEHRGRAALRYGNMSGPHSRCSGPSDAPAPGGARGRPSGTGPAWGRTSRRRGLCSAAPRGPAPGPSREGERRSAPAARHRGSGTLEPGTGRSDAEHAPPRAESRGQAWAAARPDPPPGGSPVEQSTPRTPSGGAAVRNAAASAAAPSVGAAEGRSGGSSCVSGGAGGGCSARAGSAWLTRWRASVQLPPGLGVQLLVAP